MRHLQRTAVAAVLLFAPMSPARAAEPDACPGPTVGVVPNINQVLAAAADALAGVPGADAVLIHVRSEIGHVGAVLAPPAGQVWWLMRDRLVRPQDGQAALSPADAQDLLCRIWRAAPAVML